MCCVLCPNGQSITLINFNLHFFHNKKFWYFLEKIHYGGTESERQFANVGGNCNNGANCGASYVNVNQSASNSNWNIGASLSFIFTKKKCIYLRLWKVDKLIYVVANAFYPKEKQRP